MRGRGSHPNLSHAVDINCEAAAHLKDLEHMLVFAHLGIHPLKPPSE